MITEKDGQIIQFLDHMQDLVRLRIVKDWKSGVSKEEANIAGGKRLRKIINKYERKLSYYHLLTLN